METRLDRIEKNIEYLFIGIAALKESQDRTDAQLKQTDAQILELRNAQKKTDEHILELKEAQKKTDEQLKKTDEQLQRTDAQLEKTIAKLDRIGVQLGNLGLVQGEVAEDLFYRNMGNIFKPLNLRFERVRRNIKIQHFGEYDIIAENDSKVFVIEVKNKLEKQMIDEFLIKKLPRFKQLLPKYRDRKVLAGMGALVVKDNVGRYAEKMGLYVLTQTNDGGAALLNKKGFRPKEFA